MHRQSILDPYTGLSAWKSHQQISKGEKSLLVNSTEREAEPGFCTDGFSKGAPHGKLEPSSVQLKASRILLGTGKSPRNQLRQNFLVSGWAPRLHGPLADSVIGTRLPWVPRTVLSWRWVLHQAPENHISAFVLVSQFWSAASVYPQDLLCPSAPFAALSFLLTTLE